MLLGSHVASLTLGMGHHGPATDIGTCQDHTSNGSYLQHSGLLPLSAFGQAHYLAPDQNQLLDCQHPPILQQPGRGEGSSSWDIGDKRVPLMSVASGW